MQPALQVVVLSHRLRQAQSLVLAIERAIQRRGLAHPDRKCLASDRVDPSVRGDLWFLLGVDEAVDAQTLEALRTHRLMRQALHQRAHSFEVLRGSAAQQLHQALSALSRWLPALRPEGAETLGLWRNWCENCDDPDCERRLFARLEQGKTEP
ncbi:MAG: hypothetical protein FJY42_05110 [Betaproteobacteria bacterium]|nr:hypothetical protein [Betaproteobacteria bacterium]